MKKKKIKLPIYIVVLIAIVLIYSKSNIIPSNNQTTQTTVSTIEPTKESADISKNAYKVVRVVDGDTIVILMNGEDKKVRLLSVDTPESVSSKKEENNEYGDMASAYTKSILKSGDNVYLQYDTEKKDYYGRILAYIWLEPNINTENQDDIEKYMLNAILIKNGYAVEWSSKDNRQDYLELFTKLRNAAENSNVGLWQYEKFAEIIKQ